METSPASYPDLRHQVALVTGGGRGLGRAFAEALAGAGASVAVMSRSPEPLEETVQRIRQRGGTALAITGDITVEQEVARAIEVTVAHLGSVDLLVNNAGQVTPIGPLWETDPSEWWAAMETNLRSALLCVRAVLPGMMGRGRGRVINVASGAGTVGLANGSAYVVSKTAMIRFTECVALECAPHGVSVFSIHPGTVRTRMSEYLATSPQGRKHLSWFGDRFEEILAPVESAVGLVLQLASGQADALSGRHLSIADDVVQLAGRVDEIMDGGYYTLRVRTME